MISLRNFEFSSVENKSIQGHPSCSSGTARATYCCHHSPGLNLTRAPCTHFNHFHTIEWTLSDVITPQSMGSWVPTAPSSRSEGCFHLFISSLCLNQSNGTPETETLYCKEVVGVVDVSFTWTFTPGTRDRSGSFLASVLASNVFELYVNPHNLDHDFFLN